MFKTMTKYDDMLNKIGTSTFFVLIINWCLIIKNFPQINEKINEVSSKINFPINWSTKIGGIEIEAIMLIVPLIFAILFRIFRLHNVISDILKIRLHYDIKYILTPMLNSTRITGIANNTLKIKRDKLMRQVFYKYVSVDDPKIDRHLITSALDRLVWYWIFVEGIFIITINMCICICFGKIDLVFCLLIWDVVSIVVCYRIKKRCVQATQKEVDEILEDISRKQEILGVFNGI